MKPLALVLWIVSCSVQSFIFDASSRLKQRSDEWRWTQSVTDSNESSLTPVVNRRTNPPFPSFLSMIRESTPKGRSIHVNAEPGSSKRPPNRRTISAAILTIVLLTAPGLPDGTVLSTSHAFAAEVPSVSLKSAAPRPHQRYWKIQESGSPSEKVAANAALVDFEVGTIHTMYYDPSGGAYFEPREFALSLRRWLKTNEASNVLKTRVGAETTLKETVQSLGDPFSKYLTRDELKKELYQSSRGFLGLGAIVEASYPPGNENRILFGFTTAANPVLIANPLALPSSGFVGMKDYLSVADAVTLPVVTAVAPDSAAERDGVTVGDRIVGVARDGAKSREWFLGKASSYISRRMGVYSDAAAERGGEWELTLAKPIVATAGVRDVVVGYRTTRFHVSDTGQDGARQPLRKVSDNGFGGGSALVHYELLKDTIFRHATSGRSGAEAVGYLRLTRFSRAATADFVTAIESLQKAGASSLIIDLRNNYGGVIQEAMLTASTLLRDPHAVLCYTLNSRGGFTPHEVEEYVVDTRYPGYLFSNEAGDVTLKQVKRESPKFLDEDGIMWVPPTSFASLHEQTVKRGIHRPPHEPASLHWSDRRDSRPQTTKKLVLLVNEGTASSAEVFASALHDNGRTVAVIGTKTFGKGIKQHTFPMPDGGGLRLTVAEYLTPALRHVTHVGGAQFDPRTGERIGGGIQPDIYCESKQGIPGNVGADLCVGMALDALEDAESLPVRSLRALRFASNDGSL
jgi:C-terminal processing protease CtpA/Prc